MDHLLAAVDLGSNSFRLSIGRVVQHNGAAQIYAVDRFKDHVRLAAGLGRNNVLDDAAIERAVEVLKRYGERLHGFHPNCVRAVATNTFRVARNTEDILPRAEAALGFPIEVVAGQEEARLIYTGVANELPTSHTQRLVIDIGGGSTEIIIGQGYEPLQLSSLPMGCVSFTKQFFADGRITAARMEQAQLAARREVESIAKQYRKLGWDDAYGSSGTAKGLLAVLIESGMSKKGITLEGLEKLKSKLIKDGRVIMESLPGLKPDRAVVLAGGLAIMLAAFHELKIGPMMPGEGALRVGVLYDLLGRGSQHDKRDETVHLYSKRYAVDGQQAARVRQLTLHFYHQLMLDPDQKAEMIQTLGWAADLHEIGTSITHDNYHKHGAYILQHADMPGFSNDDQALLASFVLAHQTKVKQLKVKEASREKWTALLCLRLAVLLLRRRQTLTKIPLHIENDNNAIRLHVSKAWMDAHPLTEYSLHNEIREWTGAGFNFKLIES